MKRVSIDPITRLEGHGKIDIFLNDEGDVANAYLQIPELRGFEKFCEGRASEDMPNLTARICGVCPEAHHMAATKALDNVFHVDPPYRSQWEVDAARDNALIVVGDRDPVYSVDEDGMTHIALEPTSRSGEVLLTLRFENERTQEVRAWLAPAARETGAGKRTRMATVIRKRGIMLHLIPTHEESPPRGSRKCRDSARRA